MEQWVSSVCPRHGSFVQMVVCASKHACNFRIEPSVKVKKQSNGRWDIISRDRGCLIFCTCMECWRQYAIIQFLKELDAYWIIPLLNLRKQCEFIMIGTDEGKIKFYTDTPDRIERYDELGNKEIYTKHRNVRPPATTLMPFLRETAYVRQSDHAISYMVDGVPLNEIFDALHITTRYDGHVTWVKFQAHDIITIYIRP